MQCWKLPRPQRSDQAHNSDADDDSNSRHKHKKTSDSSSRSADEIALLRYLHLLWICDPWLSDEHVAWGEQFLTDSGGLVGLEGMTTHRIAQRLLIGRRSKAMAEHPVR